MFPTMDAVNEAGESSFHLIARHYRAERIGISNLKSPGAWIDFQSMTRSNQKEAPRKILQNLRRNQRGRASGGGKRSLNGETILHYFNELRSGLGHRLLLCGRGRLGAWLVVAVSTAGQLK